MKTIATLLLLTIFGSTLVLAQAQGTQPQAAKTISWNETSHDFGKIKQNDPAGVTFTMKNSGAAPVVITAAKSSCGCTVAEFTKEPVKPGESGIVKATYNSARVGTFSKTVTVTIEGQDIPQILTIKGEVEALPAAQPTTQPTTQSTTQPVK